METIGYGAELTYPSWVEEAAERAVRAKAIHIGGVLAREASTSGVLTHKGHFIPLWIDPPFPPFLDVPSPLTKGEKEVEAWMKAHKPSPLVRVKRGSRREATSHTFPILSPVAKPAQEHEGAEDRQGEYKGRLKTAQGASGGPRRTWLDKIVA